MSFESVVIGSTARTAMSPVFDAARDERGLRLAMPARAIERRGRSVVPVCLTMRIPDGEYPTYYTPLSQTTLLAVDARTGVAHATLLGYEQLAFDSDEAAVPRIDPALRCLAYYTVDLVETLSLPQPARYWVQALYLGYASALHHVWVE